MEPLRSSLQNLEDSMKEFKPLMNKTVERTLEKGIRLGAVFAEVSSARSETSRTLTPFSSIRSQRLSLVLPKSHLRFVLSSGAIKSRGNALIVQLLKEQNKYDQMPLSLLDQLKHVSHLAEKVADEIVSEETEILVEIMPRIFKVMQEIAKFLCEYVKRGRFSRLPLFWIPQMLMVAERAGGALTYSKDNDTMDKLGEELATVIKDFLSAVAVETLRLVKKGGKHLLSQYSASPSSVVSRRASCRASRA